MAAQKAVALWRCCWPKAGGLPDFDAETLWFLGTDEKLYVLYLFSPDARIPRSRFGTEWHASPCLTFQRVSSRLIQIGGGRAERDLTLWRRPKGQARAPSLREETHRLPELALFTARILELFDHLSYFILGLSKLLLKPTQQFILFSFGEYQIIIG